MNVIKDILVVLALLACITFIGQLRETMETTQAKIESIYDQYPIVVMQNQGHYYPEVTITAYSAEVSQTNSNPYETAILEKPVSGWTCAVSKDLMKFLGSKVYIEGFGVRKVNDLMNSRYKNRIDIFVGTREQAIDVGKVERQVVFLDKDMQLSQ